MRGFSAVSLMIIDEASRVEDAMYKALRPMLAVGDGDLWLMSTPNGKRGFFYDRVGARRRGLGRGSGCRRRSVPRIAKAIPGRRAAATGATWFRQEYLCEFG